MDSENMNMNNIERAVRFIFGFAIFFVGLVIDSVWGFAGFLLVFSGLFGYDPIYAILKIDTRKTRAKIRRQAGRPKTPVTSAGT